MYQSCSCIHSHFDANVHRDQTCFFSCINVRQVTRKMLKTVGEKQCLIKFSNTFTNFTKSKALCFVAVSKSLGGLPCSPIFVFQGRAI